MRTSAATNVPRLSPPNSLTAFSLQPPSRRVAFTLIELLAVMLIICFLIAAIGSAYMHARKVAWKEKARDTGRQLAAAWNIRLADDHEFPITALVDTTPVNETGETVRDVDFDTTPTNMVILNVNINNRTYFEQNADQRVNGLRDKWKQLFHVRLDANYSGKIAHPVLTGTVVRANVIVWSDGARPGVPKEAIVVW